MTARIVGEAAGRPVHRRRHEKADGRALYLYGYATHEGEALPEEDGAVAKGGELRFHPLRDEWNLYAAHRQDRTFKPAAADDPLAPSRPGHPATEIPFEAFELAVFENKFTSLHPEAPTPSTFEGVETARAAGRCEVVVYTEEQEGSLATVGQARRRLLLAAWTDRIAALRGPDVPFVMPFESRGEEVGVTLHHPHGQIYAFPFVPGVQRTTARAFREGYDLAGAMVTAEAEGLSVAAMPGVLAWCPPYARFPLEVWVAPRRRAPGPWVFTEEEADGFANLLGEITARYDAHFGRPTPYMLTLHTAPWGEDDHWHLTAQFYPLLRAPGRVKYLASVEQGTGAFTVDVMPERAAALLQGAEPEDWS